MNDPSNWRATKSQRQEINELLLKLGWKWEDYNLSELYWLQAISVLNGLNWALNNPNQWINLQKQN